jgi:GTP-binding protein EngB required for normal cell division
MHGRDKTLRHSEFLIAAGNQSNIPAPDGSNFAEIAAIGTINLCPGKTTHLNPIVSKERVPPAVAEMNATPGPQPIRC